MKGAIYSVAIATVIISRVKITCYFHTWRYQVFGRKLTWYFIGVYVISLVSNQSKVNLSFCNLQFISDTGNRYRIFTKRQNLRFTAEDVAVIYILLKERMYMWAVNMRVKFFWPVKSPFWLDIGLLHFNIRTTIPSPPLWLEDLPFLFTLEHLKYGAHPQRIWVYLCKILWKQIFPCSPLKTKIVLKIKGSTPPKIPYFFLKLTPKKIPNFYNLPQKNSIGPQPGKKEGGY